jgi:N-acetylglucosaminyldiphosphoundecaprenol N-acetyl-beta-D-mannosaminyltransferase
MNKRITVAGVPVDPLTLEEAFARAVSLLKDGVQHLVATPNPEMAVLAHRDASFLKILESADLALADGFGLRLAGWMEGKAIPETIQGVTFTLTLAGIAEQNHYSVYLLGGGEGRAERSAKNLRENFRNLKIVGAESGGKIRWTNDSWQENPALLERIRSAKPDILFVALGHGKQERWIRDHLQRLPSVRIAMGVGGTFDFLSGEVWRAPTVFRRLHLEWLWRLILQPWRAPRIWDATVVFLWMVLKRRRG